MCPLAKPQSMSSKLWISNLWTEFMFQSIEALAVLSLFLWKPFIVNAQKYINQYILFTNQYALICFYSLLQFDFIPMFFLALTIHHLPVLPSSTAHCFTSWNSRKEAFSGLSQLRYSLPKALFNSCGSCQAELGILKSCFTLFISAVPAELLIVLLFICKSVLVGTQVIWLL